MRSHLAARQTQGTSAISPAQFTCLRLAARRFQCSRRARAKVLDSREGEQDAAASRIPSGRGPANQAARSNQVDCVRRARARAGHVIINSANSPFHFHLPLSLNLALFKQNVRPREANKKARRPASRRRRWVPLEAR